MDLQTSKWKHKLMRRSLLSAIALLIPMSALAGDCPKLGSLVSQISKSLEDVEIERASSEARDVYDALACQTELANPIVLSTLMQLSGAVHHFNEQPDRAAKAFEWAIAISPGSSLDVVYGEEAAALYTKARDEFFTQAPGKLMLIGDIQAWMDGQSIEANSTLTAPTGTHLLQWKEEADGALNSRIITVDASEERQITLGTPPPASKTNRTRTAKANPSGSTGDGFGVSQTMLYGGGALLAASAASWGTAFSAKSAFDEETDANKLSDHQSRANTFRTVAMVTTLAGAGMITTSFLLNSDSPVGLTIGPLGIYGSVAW
jgi:hypothetical protein